ncbi:AsmA-like C-terminal region-containing protein, partial [Pseudomonadota bacterium]
FSLRAQGAEASGQYEASIRGSIGDISLDASARVSDLSELNSLDLKLAANGPSLGSFTRAFGIENWPDKPFSIKGDVDRVGGTLNISGLTLNIGGTQLVLDALLTDFPNLDASRIKISVEGDDITQFRELVGLPGVTTGPFNIHGKLDVSEESVELVQVEVVTSLGQATFSGILGPAPEYIGSKLQLHMNGHNARSLMSVFGIDALPEQAFNVNTRFELLKNGLQVERSVLVTIADDRLELGGFIAFKPGIEGSDLDIRVSGNNLAEMLQRVVDTTGVPAQPYDLSGRVKILENGLRLENVKLDFEGIRLGATGSVNLGDHLLGSGLDFQISGDDFSSLGDFEVIGDSLDMFIPGLPYRAAGRFTVEPNGWKLSDTEGQLGKTNFELDGLVGNQDGMAGSNAIFSIKGPGLNQLIVDQGESSLHTQVYESSGQIMLSKDRLSIQKLTIKTDQSNADIVLDFGWPIGSSMDVDFDLKLRGSDIRQLLPDTGSFKPAQVEFKLETIGGKRGKMFSLERFTADIGNLQITTVGEIDEDPDGEKVDLSFSVVSSDISKLGQIDGESLPSLPLDLKADFTGNAKEFIFQNLYASLGESRLEGLLVLSLKGSKPDITLTAKSSFIDLRPFIGPDSSKGSETADEDVDSAKPERLIPATPLPLDALAAADVLLRLNIAEVKYWKDSVRNLVLESGIKAGHLDVPEFSFEAPGGKLRTSFSIQPTGADQADVKIDLDAEKLVLNLSGQPKEKLHLVPSFNLDFKITGKGSNLQEVAGSSNGAFYMESSGGTLAGVNLSILDTFILDEIFSLIMPKSSQNDDLVLKCAATILNIKDGIITTNPGLAFTTDQIAIIAKGSLDLKTEKMQFNFNATPTNALKISAGELFNPYILVSGTLSKPAVGIDPGKAILHGGAAIGTAGISILAKGLLDRVGNAVPVCEEMQNTVRQGTTQTKDKKSKPVKR